jgi:hypothetical protein
MAHQVSRRTVLKSGVAVAAAAAAGVTTAGLVGWFSDGRKLTWEQSVLRRLGKSEAVKLTRSQFTPHVNSTFTAKQKGQSTRLVLTEVNDLRSAQAPNEEHRFSLVFTAPNGAAIDPGLYEFTQPKLGTVALFVTPVDLGRQGRRYEAVVNRRG